MAEKQSLEVFANRLWYGPRSPIHYLVGICLLPLSVIYGVITRLRRLLYRLGVLSVKEISVPVIVIGNITVGGTGKTPLTISIARQLLNSGLRVGIVSRGYGNKSEQSEFPLCVETNMSPHQCGDEPLLTKRNLPEADIVVDPQRARGASYLFEKCHCDVIICDDGLQHYALSRNIEIVVIDESRQFGNGLFLPVGPMREAHSRLKRCDFIVSNTGTNVKEASVQSELNDHGNVSKILMQLEQGSLINLKTGDRKPLSDYQGEQVHLVAGIGNPDRFFSSVESLGIHTINHALPDHYDLDITDVAFSDNLPVIMTEKDAVKLSDVQVDHLWYLPINANLPVHFIKLLNEKITNMA